jgi:O-antigen/teichoic acid export membrane protein
MFLVESLSKFVNNGNNRSVRVKKNIAVSFLIRGLSVAISFSIVPLTISYVNPVQYGIWLAITSIVSWFTFFDFGIGNGLRNKLATAIAFQEYDKARKYVSTTYAILSIVAFSVFILFCFVNPYINWNKFLNITSSGDRNIHLVLLVVLGAFCIQFVVQLLNTVLISFQESAQAEFITLLGQAGLLITLVILKYSIKGSLDTLVIALNVAPMIVMFFASLWLYNRKLKIVAPSVKYVNFSYAGSILNLGGVFFLIQVGALILFQTDNIIITRILGPEAVTKFNVTYKLYSVIIMAFSIILTPYWSAFTDAWAKKDYQWINRSMKRLREIWFFTSFLVIPVFFLLAKYIFRIWLGDFVSVNSTLSMCMALYVVCYTCQVLNCYFLNGIGKLRVQLILYLLIIVSNVPLGIIMGKWLGIEGVIIANIIAFVFMNVFLWIQINKILRHKAVGIWNR